MTIRGWAAALAAFALCAAAPAVPSNAAAPFDLVLAGGRVLDPESGLDARRDVGLRAGRIEAVSPEPLEGGEVVDVTGLVVAPGFIDLHAHGQDPRSNEFQARDGVTTALDLELGAFPVEAFYAARGGKALLNHGVASGHIPARIRLKDGVDAVHPPTTLETATGLRGALLRLIARFWRPSAYATETASPEEVSRLRALVAQGLDDGGLGVGMALDYTPAATDEEIRSLFALAAERRVPAIVHMRGVSGATDMSAFDELLGHVEATGAALHLVHITSSAQKRLDAYLAGIEKARARGLDVTTEAYPYAAGSTRIESAYFDEGWQERLGIGYADLQWSETGERLTRESFERYRRQGGWVILHSMTSDMVDRAIAHPLVMIASDGIPFLKGGEHPRGAGTFARVLGRYVRERRVITLMEAVRKMALAPAKRLESFVPQMRRKGRIRPGADADITVFDPERVVDRATFEDSWQPSAGIVHVLVGGTFVVRDGAPVPGVSPGEAIRADSPG
jgi:dihydroorotase